jgi:hypothetical protein
MTPPLERALLKVRILIACREMIADELVPSAKRLRARFPDRSEHLLYNIRTELRDAGLITWNSRTERLSGLGESDHDEVQERIKAIRDQKIRRGPGRPGPRRP